MNGRSQYLLELAKCNVKAYIVNPKVKAAMVTGSVAEGLCDEYSDIDMSIYYEKLPSEEELQLARQQNRGSERLWIIGDYSDGGFAEAYSVHGVECQFGHVTIEQWEKDISTVLEQHDVKSPMMKAMSGTLICIPLYGEKLVQQWKMRVANYPDALAQAMVEQYLKFFPLWGLQKHLAERDATLFYYQILVE
ncbi:MAG: nucleotidyltransferase domain-containing protein [Chroococcidiopsidaceae cyanobacterium CP_BM_RX_35]|nr:nucleotidyltransferase domain-containing protein [Chroococcidiopsidaceae cyanobacterium CP_BM_RX_35]